MLIDLHTHTNASDGTDSPTQLIDKAINRGINILALTDHDTTRGWGEAETALLNHPSKSGMKLVLGSEISCQDDDGISIHMLGLLFDPDYQPLFEVLERTRENRHSRMERIIARPIS